MKIILACWLILFVAGCKTAPPQQTVGVPIPTPPDPAAKDPVCCGPYSNEAIKRAWADFTRDGRYKLARDHAYLYSWGNLNHFYYDNHQHLTVSVVDTTKTEPNRYGVVIFTAPESDGGRYRHYWFYRDRAVPAALSGASGYLFIDGCSVLWNASHQKYVCT